jgi:hypothetical protein
MMAQYLALKADAEDCLLLYRMGDFFESARQKGVAPRLLRGAAASGPEPILLA